MPPLPRVAPTCSVPQASSLLQTVFSTPKSPQRHASPTLGSMTPGNPELLILYVCLKTSRRTGSAAAMEFPVRPGEPAPLPCRGGSRPRAPAPGPTSGAGAGGRCAGQVPRAFGGSGGVGAGGGGPRGPGGHGSPGSEAGAQASRLAGHEPRPRRVGGFGPRRWSPGTRTSNPGRGTPDPFRPRRAGAPRGAGPSGRGRRAAARCPRRPCVLGQRGPGRGSGSGVRGG